MAYLLVGLLVASVALAAPVRAQTALGTRAAQMAPGTWAQLPTNGFVVNGQPIIQVVEGGSYILQYADEMVWDPAGRRLYFNGAAHGDPGRNAEYRRFISYEDATNSWRVLPDSGIWTAHTYDHLAFNPTTGIYYHRVYNSNQVDTYNTRTGQWGRLPNIPTGAWQVAGALEYFPEMNALVFVDGEWGVWAYGLGTGQWQQLSPRLAMGPYHTFSRYNPVHRVMVFGGGNGSRDLYRLTASGTITRMRTAPIDLGITHTIFTLDPTSGKYLVFGKTAVFYEYDVTTDTWALQPASKHPPFFQSSTDGAIFGTVATPVSTYGVVLFVDYEFASSAVYLYKHASGGTPPDSVAPSEPGELKIIPPAAPVSGASR